MSADDGIYILETLDGFRVVHTQNIGEIYWDDKKKKIGDKINTKILKAYFKYAKFFKTKEEALIEAVRMEESILEDGFTLGSEYGIQFIRDWKKRRFPK